MGRKENEYDHKLAALAENIPGGVHQCKVDENLTLVSMNRSFLNLVGYTEEEICAIFHNHFAEMIYAPDRAQVLARLNEQKKSGDTLEMEYRVLRKDGELLWILDRGKVALDEDGENCFYCMLVDITERKKTQEELRLTMERVQVIMEHTSDIIIEWDMERDTLAYSANWRDKFGYEPVKEKISKALPGSPYLHEDDVSAFISILQEAKNGTPRVETELRILSRTGDYVWCRVRGVTQYSSDGKAVKAVGIITDIAEEKRRTEELLELTRRDALTGLYNKAAIQAFVEEQIKKEHMQPYQMMMIIDLDDFKSVNDTYGHLCGDNLLSDVAATLRAQFRATDLVGRIGGDEFLVYLPSIVSQEAAEAKAASVLAALRQLRYAENAPNVLCSIGIALFPQKACDYFALYQCADRALYNIKRKGKNGYAFYDPATCDDGIPCGLARSAISETIESSGANLVDEQLAQYAFRMLYESGDIMTVIGQLLEIVGRAYDVSRVYIFESSVDGKRCSKTFEWCAPGVSSEMQGLQNLSYTEDLGDYLRNFDEKGTFYCRDTKQLHPALYAILKPIGVAAMLQCAILDGGCFKGFVGFDECRENRMWKKEQIASLKLIANVLATFLIKERMGERINELERQRVALQAEKTK